MRTNFTKMLLMALAIAWGSIAAAVPPPPVPARFVADLAHVFPDNAEVDELEEYLGTVSDSSGIQVQIVTVGDLEGEAPYMYARNIGEEWGVGDESKNNGVVILIKPKNDTPGEVFISTGYGSECVLTDAACSKIIGLYMIDHLREGDYFKAASEAAHICAEMMISGNDDLISSNYSSADDDSWGIGGWIGLTVILLPFLLGLGAWLSPKRRARRDIRYAQTKDDLDKALQAADRCQLPEKDRAEAMASMRSNMYSYIQGACTPELQQQMIAAAAGMPLSEARIAEIVQNMKTQTLEAFMHCTSSSSLQACMERAIAFGNDAEPLQASFAAMLAALKAAEAKARREAAVRRSSQSSSSSSSSSGQHYGGGHFGGGGAGRSF